MTRVQTRNHASQITSEFDGNYGDDVIDRQFRNSEETSRIFGSSQQRPIPWRKLEKNPDYRKKKKDPECLLRRCWASRARSGRRARCRWHPSRGCSPECGDSVHQNSIHVTIIRFKTRIQLSTTDSLNEISHQIKLTAINPQQIRSLLFV